MSLLDLPIPPKPAAFTPAGVPPGITANLSALVVNVNALEDVNSPPADDCCSDEYSAFIERQEALIAAGQVVVDEAAWQASDANALLIAWYLNRPFIRPRTIVVHTNGASVEASSQSQINWGNAAASNTKAHYSINQPTPQKLVPTDRRAIANATGSEIEQRYGVQDSSFWSIAIETADMGANRAVAEGRAWPTDCGPFLHDHAELIARIIAYECIVWGIPPVWQTNYTGTGIVSHTAPFPYPYFTIQPGKTCPGSTKKWQVQHELVPRAAQIVAAWTTPEGELDMATVDEIHAQLALLGAAMAQLSQTVNELSAKEAERYSTLTTAAVDTGRAQLDAARNTQNFGKMSQIERKVDLLVARPADTGSGGGGPTNLRVVLEGTATSTDPT